MRGEDNSFWNALLVLAYGTFLELTSIGATSEISPCIVLSQQQSTNDYAGNQSCAAVHEAVFMLARFIYDSANHDNIIAFGTVVIAFFTLALWWSTSKLWRAGEVHSERELRAYVSIVEIRLRDIGDHDVRIVINNGGATPARQVEGFLNWVWYKGENRRIPADYDFATKAAEGDDTIFVLDAGAPPREIIFPFGDQAFTAEQMIQAARSNLVTIFFYGEIRYVDVFGKRRATEFCYLYVPDRQGGGKNLRTWGTHNKST
jgi:hypothetical protein